MRIAVGADHGGVGLKDQLVAHLLAHGHDVIDHGTHGRTSVDYPDRALSVARDVRDGSVDRGVLVCGTGQGMAIAANKVAGVRAAVVADPFSARMAAEHNDARILCLGERVLGAGLALDCLDAWLGASFQEGRHARRVAMIDAIEATAGADEPARAETEDAG